MSPELQVVLKLELSLGELSGVFYNSLQPDERFRLRGLTLKSSIDGEKLVIEIECSRGPLSVLATLDDLFSAISVVEDICEGSQDKGRRQTEYPS